MAFPTAIVTKAGRKLFKDAKGRFISEAKYNLLNRRGPGGRFLSKEAAERRGPLQSVESRLRSQLGAPPRGQNSWVSIANKYPERFGQFL